MMTPTSYPDSYNDTKLPAVTGKALPSKGKPAPKKKKHPKPLHARLAAAMENC